MGKSVFWLPEDFSIRNLGVEKKKGKKKLKVSGWS